MAGFGQGAKIVHNQIISWGWGRGMAGSHDGARVPKKQVVIGSNMAGVGQGAKIVHIPSRHKGDVPGLLHAGPALEIFAL